MVANALLLAVANRIRTALSTDDFHVRVMPDAKPIPAMGAWFISIYGGKFKKVHENSYCIRGPFRFHLTLTARATPVPFDRQGTELTAKATTGMIEILESAIASVENRNTDIVNTVNTSLGYVGVENGPLLIDADFEAKERRGGNWLQADNTLTRPALTMEATFESYINRTRT